jgi:hypothetical protein
LSQRLKKKLIDDKMKNSYSVSILLFPTFIRSKNLLLQRISPYVGSVYSLTIDSSDFGFFNAILNGVYRSVQSTTSIRSIRTNEILDEFVLQQNYPKQFNPNTISNFSVPVSGFVISKIYNSLGREMENLINENKEAENYSVYIDASKQSIGMYYYNFQSGSHKITKKMMSVKLLR